MASLHRHLQLTQAQHDRLGFRADCPYCQRRLLGRYPEARPLSRRGEAAAGAGLVAASALLPAAGAMAKQPGAPTPGAPPAVVADGGGEGQGGGQSQGGGHVKVRGGVELPPLIDNGDVPSPSAVPQNPVPDTDVELELPSSDAPVSGGSGGGSSGGSGGSGGGGQANPGGSGGGGGGQANPGGSGGGGGSSGRGDSSRGSDDGDGTSGSSGDSDRGRGVRGGPGGSGGGETGSGGSRGGSGGGQADPGGSGDRDGEASPGGSSDDAGPGDLGLAPRPPEVPKLPAPFAVSSGGGESSTPDRQRAPETAVARGGLFVPLGALAQALVALASPSDSDSSSSDQAAEESDSADRSTEDSAAQEAPSDEDQAQEEPPAGDDDESSGDATHVVQAGESLWLIAEGQLDRDASDAEVAGEVERLWDLNSERIGTGNPDLIYAGQELQL